MYIAVFSVTGKNENLKSKNDIDDGASKDENSFPKREGSEQYISSYGLHSNLVFLFSFVSLK